MDLSELQSKYSNLNKILAEPASSRIKLLNISEFFDYLLKFSNPTLMESYLAELLPVYISYIKSLKIRGLDPNVIPHLDKQIHQLRRFEITKDFKDDFSHALTVLKNKNELLTAWVQGKIPKNQKNYIYFPVIENFSTQKPVGFLEILQVSISEGENQFIVEPYYSELDTELTKQLHLCWDQAIKYCHKYIRNIKSEHTVHLTFENRLGIYVGNSLGMALTLAFIEAILKFYKASIIIKTNGIVAMSGGIDSKNNFISIGKSPVEIKVETTFYSDARFLCVPKGDEIFAENKLAELQKGYPDRKLGITGLSDFEDLLSRRNIIEIRIYSWFGRLLRFLLNKWQSILFALAFTIVLLYIFALDLDDNPALFEHKGKILNVQNENGKTLWSANLFFDAEDPLEDLSKLSHTLIDINNDNINEVILACEDFELNSKEYGRVVCFDKDKNLIWEYNFFDTVSTFKKWSNKYLITIFGNTVINEKTVLILSARNLPNFPHAVFMLDAETGKRFDSTSIMWNAGGLNNALIGDFNKDGKEEIILAGIHNGFERAILFSVDLDKIRGQTPSPERYKFRNIPLADLNNFVLLPHTDYGQLFYRYNLTTPNGMYFDSATNEIVIPTMEGIDKRITFYYGFDTGLNFLWVDSGDNAQKLRDSLVQSGILKPPLTNTEEYFKILENEIEYWDGEKFIKK